MTSNDLRRNPARVRDQINDALEKHPSRDITGGIALRQDLHVEFGTPFLERTQGKLQERARTIVERRPELDGFFDDAQPKPPYTRGARTDLGDDRTRERKARKKA